MIHKNKIDLSYSLRFSFWSSISLRFFLTNRNSSWLGILGTVFYRQSVLHRQNGQTKNSYRHRQIFLISTVRYDTEAVSQS